MSSFLKVDFQGVPTNITMMPRLLQQAGYATHGFGKFYTFKQMLTLNRNTLGKPLSQVNGTLVSAQTLTPHFDAGLTLLTDVSSERRRKMSWRSFKEDIRRQDRALKSRRKHRNPRIRTRDERSVYKRERNRRGRRPREVGCRGKSERKWEEAQIRNH